MPISRRDCEAGVTLVEMLLVLAILALASGLVVGRGLPGAGLLDRARLEGFLVDARARAMVSGRPVEIAAQPDRLVARQQDGTVVAYAPQAFPEVSGPIWFLPDGTSDGGRIALSRGDGSTYGAEIVPPTGRIVVSP